MNQTAAKAIVVLALVLCAVPAGTALAQEGGGGFTPPWSMGDPTGSGWIDPREAAFSSMSTDPYGFDPVYNPQGYNSQGYSQPGGLSYGASLGRANVSFSGNPNPGAYGAGFNVSGRGGSGGGGQGGSPNGRDPVWSDVRDFQFGAYSSETQTVLNAGGTLAFTYEDEHAVAGRALLGGAFGDLAEDTYHFSGDLFVGTQTEVLGDHWLKGGLLYDQQDQFSKLGPELGVLLFAESRRPVSVDLAYGIGNGDPQMAGATLTSVADDDLQLRVGTFFGPYVQLGVTGTWYSWDDELLEDVNGYGGFATLNLDFLQLTFDLTTDDLGTRGFANVALTTGAWSIRDRDKNGRLDGQGPQRVVHPRDWLTRPVIRDVSLRMQSRVLSAAEAVAAGVPGAPGQPGGPAPPGGVGNITGVAFLIQFPSRVPGLPGPSDANGNGIIDPGEQFEIDVQFTNSTAATANNVSFAFTPFVVPTGSGQAGSSGAAVGNVGPGQVVITNAGNDIDAAANATFPVGGSFFVGFEVTADGQTRNFLAGPIIIGGANTLNTPIPAIPQ
jgi:hypothetical protein